MENTEADHDQNSKPASRNFIQQILDQDMQDGLFEGKVHTRFPPEPNGYLHIGHAKSICLNFGLAAEYPNAKCNLRFDDTNPVAEEEEYVDSIKEDVKWLGFDWEDRLHFTSDYFGQLYDFAKKLIEKGKAYVCDLNAEQTAEHRGTITSPGKNSPFRDRPVEENLDLFRRMSDGEFPDGSKTLKAKIDMSHPNLNMRDPVLYRILHAPHHKTGNKWCIYPMYDFAHGQSDSIEGITHSICTLEFENHRPLYDWFLNELDIHHPKQIEFARLNLTHTIMSKRKLLTLVKEGHVQGWDDPRMPTLCGMRRRGFTPEAIRNFCERIGVAKVNSTNESALLEHFVRENLNKNSPRVMAVLNPLKVTITNYPDGQSEELDAVNNPEDPDSGSRKVPFAKHLVIERDDFMEDAPKKFFRLAPGREVRLRYAYFITCQEVVKDQQGNITELLCTYDPETKGGKSPDGRKVKGTLHWVAEQHAASATIHLYEYLFNNENPGSQGDIPFVEEINPDSLKTIQNCLVEPSLTDTCPGDRYQFERLGYFCTDSSSTPEQLVFNRTITLKDSWAKIKKKN